MGRVLKNEGLLFILIGVIGIIDGFRLNRISLAANEAYGPGIYLIILSALMMIGGIYLVIIKIKNINKKTEAFRFRNGPASLAIIAMFLYSIFVSLIGYMASTALFILFTIRLFNEKSWVKTIFVAGASAFAFWYIFVNIARIPLP